MTFLNKFLEEIGVTPETIVALENEENPEDFDIKPLVDGHLSTRTKLFENKYKDQLLSEEELDKKFAILKETHRAKINKQFELNYTRKELKEMDLDTILLKAQERVDELTTAAQGQNDEELVVQVKKLQTEIADKTTEMDTVKDRFESDLTKAQGAFDNEIKTIKVDNLFAKEFDEFTFGLDAELIPMVKRQVQQEILAKYVVNADGTLEGLDGTHAQDFEGQGIYESVKEPITHLLKKYKAIAKVKVDDPLLRTPKGGFDTKDMSPAALEMLKSIKENAAT